MIIQCDKCQTKYRLDDSKLTNNGVKVRCTKCQNVFVVPPAMEDVHIEEVIPDKRNDGANLSFDFSGGEKTQKEVSAAPHEPPSPKKEPTFNNLDFSFARDDSGSGKTEESADEESGKGSLFNAPDDFSKGFQFKVNPPEEKKADNDIDFSFDDIEKDKPVSETADVDMPGLDSGEDRAEEEKTVAERSEPSKVIPFSAGYGRDGRAASTPAPKVEEESDEVKFSDVFSRAFDKKDEEAEGNEAATSGTGEPDEDEEVEDFKETIRQKPPQKRMGLIIGLLVIVLGGGIVYFSGIIDKLAQTLAPSSSVEKTIEIETIKGSYVENRNFGKFFVVEARIKNITESSQAVKAVTGVLYNSKGDKIASRSVSPGRVVNAEDLKNLTKEDLSKPFNDPSGGLIPPKGVVPIMVPFMENPQGVTEYGLEIVR